MKLSNVLRSAVHPRRFPIMLKKLWKRIGDRRSTLACEENLRWLAAHAVDLAELARGIDARLWAEAEAYAQRLEEHAERVLSAIPHDLGGGGAYPFLYFLTRARRPDVIVETGVAAGFSSHAFLSALRANGAGKLYSSDFPYFRLPRPERFIGVLIDDELRQNWELHIDGDEVNLPRILSRVKRVDIVHYDSDKSYSGRQTALALLLPRLAENGVAVVDDIGDNSHFHDLVTGGYANPWRVAAFQGKYLGILGDLTRT